MAAPSRAATAEWRRCPSCQAFVYHKRLRRNLHVCPECNHHFRLLIRDRIAMLLDEGSYEELSGDLEPVDALSFADSKPYPERIAAAQKKSGAKSGALYGTGTIGGRPLAVAGIDFGFIGGSMGGAVGESITLAAELALERRIPLLVISASGGARMQEGCVSLMQMAKTSQAIGRLYEEGILYVSLLTDPTYGGVSASFATLGDVLIAEPDAHIGFAGPTVIEQTIRQTLPDGFQTAGFLMDHGMLDLVETRENLGRMVRNLVDFHARAEEARQAAVTGSRSGFRRPRAPRRSATRTPSPERDPWDVVQLARNLERPHTLDYVGFVFDDFLELHGDRQFREDPAIVSGLAQLGELRGGADRPPEGQHDGRDDGAQLRDAGARRLSQGHAHDALRGQVRPARDHAGGHRGRLPGPGCRGARAVQRDRRVDHADVAAPGALHHGRDRRGRLRRRTGAGGGRPRADARELVLLGDQPRGLRHDPVQGRGGRAARGGGASDHGARTSCAWASWTRSFRSRARARTPTTTPLPRT